MIQYNVTIKLEQEVEKDWLEYMQEQHIQDVLDTGLFLSCRMSRMISHAEEGEPSYTIQYTLESMAKMHEYQSQHAARLQADHNDRFKNKFVAFRTLMEIIGESQ